MKDHNRIENYIEYSQPKKPASPWREYPDEKLDTRMPLLRLDILKHQKGMGHDLYLINSSNEILESVIADNEGFTTDEMKLQYTTEGKYSYDNVKHNEAVKIDELDNFYDLDFQISNYIFVKSKALSTIIIELPSKKGGIKQEKILLWDNDDVGESVSIKNIENEIT